jgi:hypothetical protein
LSSRLGTIAPGIVKREIDDALDPSARLQGSESARVDAALEQQFKSPFAKISLLRMAAAPEPRTGEGEALLKQVTETIRRIRGVQGVMSYLDRQAGTRSAGRTLELVAGSMVLDEAVTQEQFESCIRLHSVQPTELIRHGARRHIDAGE